MKVKIIFVLFIERLQITVYFLHFYAYFFVDEQKSVHTPEQDAICSSEDISENSRQNGKQEDCENTSSLQIILTEDQTKHNEKVILLYWYNCM